MDYNSPGTTRFTCPNCGKPHSFAPYVDEDGVPVDVRKYGRCNHESRCGYHLYPPYQPHQRSSFTYQKPRQTDAPKSEPLCTIPAYIVEQASGFTATNNLTAFLLTCFKEEEVKRVVSLYHIGTTAKGHTIFYQFDIQGRCRGGKIIPYNPETGHRIKDDHFPPVMWVHTDLKAAHLLPPEWRLTQCLFGEHLLQDKVNANVALVESEKTAVICSLLLPEYIWLATGGKSQFNDRLMVLKGRKVTAFPDIDGYDEWRKKAKNYPMLDITISDILERNATPDQLERQVDIADVLLEEMLREKYLCLISK